MISKAGSLCLHAASSFAVCLCQEVLTPAVFVEGQAVDGASVLCKQEIKSCASVEYRQIPVHTARNIDTAR